jgi:hypothetical protein
MGLEKIEKKFDLFGIQTHPIPLNPHGLRANRTSPNQSLYKLEKQSGSKSFRPTNLAQTNKTLCLLGHTLSNHVHRIRKPTNNSISSFTVKKTFKDRKLQNYTCFFMHDSLLVSWSYSTTLSIYHIGNLLLNNITFLIFVVVHM